MPPAHIDPSLDVLRAQLRAQHPGIVIYWIGDDAHQAGPSDHNPEEDGSVDAIDLMINSAFTTAEANGLVDVLTTVRDARLSYIIWRARIWNRRQGWRPYAGRNPHDDHVHISRNDVNEPSRAPWTIRRPTREITYMQLDVTLPALREGDDDAALPGYNMIGRIQAIVGAERDGVWGPNTTAKIAAWCKVPAATARTLTPNLYREIFGLG